MNSLLERVCRACLLLDALPFLASLRARRDVRGIVSGRRLWLRWPEGDDEVLQHVLPIHGSELFTRHEGQWYRPGRRVPESNLPDDDEGRPLHDLLLPAPCRPEALPGTPLVRVGLRLARDPRPRMASAMKVPLTKLRGWCDRATTWEFEQLQAACCGEWILLRGAPLPAVSAGTRYWGRSILVPLGYRVEPDWPEETLRLAIGLEDGETVLLGGGIDDGTSATGAPASPSLTRRASTGGSDDGTGAPASPSLTRRASTGSIDGGTAATGAPASPSLTRRASAGGSDDGTGAPASPSLTRRASTGDDGTAATGARFLPADPEVVGADAFGPLTRAALRRACGDGEPC